MKLEVHIHIHPDSDDEMTDTLERKLSNEARSRRFDF